MTKNIGLVWLKDDFRFKRNLALIEATKKHDQVVTFFLYKKKKFDNQEAQKWWISESLKEFKKRLINYNINLEVIAIDTYKSFFEKLFQKKGFSIYWNKTYEPNYLKLDEYLKTNFEKNHIEYDIFKGNILNEFNEVKKNDGTPFKVFTPFWRNAEKYYMEKIPTKEKKISKCIKKITFFKKTMDDEEIYPNKQWFKKFEKYWIPSEENASKELKNFIAKRIQNYSDLRNFPYLLGTSKLSPYIKHGQLHVETIWEECNKIKNKGVNKFLAEIGWREFNHSLINYFPYMLQGNYSKKFDKFPWEKNSKLLSAWKKGLTGYPVVDAGMRELYSTGWMHNRVRMIVGSFLVKHLLIHWVEGEKHFRKCLLDYNEANNISGWQWVAGCGADAAPYFRIFNPILQGEKFDKDGDYVKKWVPELRKVPKKFIHKPWELEDKSILILNKDYPSPVVKHEEARSRALAAFKKI
ncbi:DNA photolyase family protein [Candidatus Pelagibacter bacterium]|nr:DNA photolyase family protein [Candidatus Pelagibacter bacterium]